MILDEIPQQNLDRVCAPIVKCLDEVASHQLSFTAWDMFAFPKEDEQHWQEDCLSYYPQKVVNIGTRMPGIWLIMQDMKGGYCSNACILLYEGQMLAFDPASNLTEWVPMQGVSSLLTYMELKSAYNINNIFPWPHPKAISPSSQAAGPLCCLPAGRKWTLTLMEQTLRSGINQSMRIGHAAQPSTGEDLDMG